MNKTGRRLDNLRFTAHLTEAMQVALASPGWYNEPVSLAPAQGGELSAGIAYTWTPFVLPKDAAALEQLGLNDFYDMLLEIAWDGGREVLRLDRASAVVPDGVDVALKTDGPFGEEDLAELLTMAAEAAPSAEG